MQINKNHLADDFNVEEQKMLEVIFYNLFKDSADPEEIINEIILELNEMAEVGDLNFKYAKSFAIVRTAQELIDKLVDMK